MKKSGALKSLPSLLTLAPRLLGALFLAAAVAGCSSVKVHVDKGQVRARTFSFMDTGSRRLANNTDPGQEAHALIQQALINNLAVKGVKYVPTGGDVTVAYLVVIGNNVQTTSLNDYFGYTDESAAIVDKLHAEQTGGDAKRGYFEDGTLIIDIVSPSTSKLLQRRSIQAPPARDLPTEARAKRIQSIVDQALKGVPISS